MDGDTDTNTIQRVHSSSGTSSSSIPKQINPNLHLNPALTRSHQQFCQPLTAGNRVGAPLPIPPISPYSQIPATLQPKHSRSMSQPSSFFSFDSLPPLNPSPPAISVSMENKNGVGVTPSLPPSPFTMCHSSSSRNTGNGETLPPRKSHRRSNSDVTFEFGSMMAQNRKSPLLIASRSLDRSISGGEVSDWSNLVKEEPREGFFKGRKPDSEAAMDDVFTAYMNLDNIDVLNSFGGEGGKNGNENAEEMESSRGSGTKKPNGASSSDSEGESSASGNVKVPVTSSAGVKRRAGGDIAPTSRHYRSVSMDSCFMGKLNFGDESSLELPPSSAKVSPTSSPHSSAYRIEFGNSEFTAAEMRKIAADEKLAEIVIADPKRVKRILANRVSAARSKERKTQYMAELEHKVQTLQTEATTLSAQLTHLQRDSMGLANQNSELKFRLQAMEQQAQLRDALSEKLAEEVQRLKLVTGEPGRRQSDSSSESKRSLNPEMFQQLSISQLEHQQISNSSSNQSNTMKRASNELAVSKLQK